MKAVVKECPGPGFVLRDVAVPQPRRHQVLVKVEAVGICGSDIPIFEGARAVLFPRIPGHEFAGVIVELGPGVTRWNVGDRVGVGLVTGCGNCYLCRAGEESLCDNATNIGFQVDGAYAEYTVVPTRNLHHLPGSLSFEQGSQIDPVATPWRATERVGIHSSDTVLIFGPGPVGLYMLQVAKAQGARLVIMVGRSERRLALARQLGADALIDSSTEDVVGKVAEYTDGRMAAVVVEASGNPAVIPLLVETVAKMGRIAVLGVIFQPAGFNVDKLLRKEARMSGFICYNWNDYEGAMQLIETGRVRVEPVITHRLPLEEIGRALGLIRSREAVKVVLTP